MINHLYMSHDTAHQCHVKGCHSVLVLDGNMKNRRDVCKARHAGYVNPVIELLRNAFCLN